MKCLSLGKTEKVALDIHIYNVYASATLRAK